MLIMKSSSQAAASPPMHAVARAVAGTDGAAGGIVEPAVSQARACRCRDWPLSAVAAAKRRGRPIGGATLRNTCICVRTRACM